MACIGAEAAFATRSRAALPNPGRLTGRIPHLTIQDGRPLAGAPLLTSAH